MLIGVVTNLLVWKMYISFGALFMSQIYCLCGSDMSFIYLFNLLLI